MAMNELDQLGQMLKRGGQASSELAGLDEQFARANALRDTPDTRRNKYGTVSPLAALADNVYRANGHIKGRGIAPQREAARASVADAASALPMFKARQDQKAIELAAGNRSEDQALAKDIRDEKRGLAKAKLEYEQGSLKDVNPMWYRDGTEVQVGYDAQGRPVNADTREPMAVSELLSADPALTAATVARNTGKGKGSFNKPSAKQTDEFEKSSRNAADIRDVVGKFTADFANPAGGAPLMGSASNFLAREAPLLTTEGAEKRQAWWANYKMAYELPVRHKMFGSALTAPETEQWRQASINPNMTEEQIRTNLAEMDRLTQLALNQMAKNATLKNWDTEWIEYNTGYGGKEEEYSATTIAPLGADGKADYTVVPNGLDPVAWDDLTEAAKQDYYEYGEEEL